MRYVPSKLILLFPYEKHPFSCNINFVPQNKSVKERGQTFKTKIVAIPRAILRQLQLLNVSINKTFKSFMKE